MTNDHAFPENDNALPANGDAATLTEFATAVDLLSELSQAGLEDTDDRLHEVVAQLSCLADAVDSSLSDFNDDDPEVIQMVQFVVNSCNTIRQTLTGDDGDQLDSDELELLLEAIEIRLESGLTDQAFNSCSNDEQDSSDGDLHAPSPEEIAALLSGLGSAIPAETPAAESDGDEADTVEADTFHEHGLPPQAIDLAAETEDEDEAGEHREGWIPTGDLTPPPADEVEVDADLFEAFMDDATRGLETIEQALLDLESNPGDSAQITNIGRELHTIKGASATVGWANLAAFIHEVEELIRRTIDANDAITSDLLLPHVDVIRARVEGRELPEETTDGEQVGVVSAPAAAPALAPAPSPNPITAPAQAPAPPASQAASQAANKATDDETVRVKASQLNRLMDMLSELVMLRNQRDTEISELRSIHDELVHSVTRLRMLSHEGEAILAADHGYDLNQDDEGVSFSHLNEVANDVLDSAQRIRDCYQPVADGNQAVSQFIRNFRLELVQLRRMPVSGLFRRLHRAISDAAKAEQKQVRVELVGEDTGIERSLQERIFEPLMHIVRNSVSHGIETPEERVAEGKLSAGTVKLHAHSGPDLLVIEVTDDGRGLNYDAIRRRGIERGLIDPDKSISRAELARLIFHPGFSTRESANQISGRGVGMDVVASTLERMRGWVEVESEYGLGSTIRLSLPLPSMIQHAMVFRSGGQLFAFPAQSVRRTGEFTADHSPIDINDILDLSNQHDVNAKDYARRPVIELATSAATVDGDSKGDIAFLVDHVLGPEEVVVRPMPPMLKSHPLCTGATLSGMGEVVLLLDPRQLVDATKYGNQVQRSTDQSPAEQVAILPQVLVVDDSKSARLAVKRALEKYPVQVIQAEDGQLASELLAKQSFATVISDIDMPRMNGMELLTAIKNEPKNKEIPVLMISSRNSDTTGKQACELGAIGYIQKPITPERFDEIVSDLPWANATN